MKKINHAIREIVIVIIGILIALFINNWNEERKDKEYRNQIFSSIEKELLESKLELEKVIPKQKALIDTLNRYIDNDTVSLYEIILKGNGMNTPNIKTNSWNAIANSRIEIVAYEKLSELAEIQERKDNLNLRNNFLLEFIFQNFENSDRKKKEIFEFLIGDIINAEQYFQLTIEEILKKDLVTKGG